MFFSSYHSFLKLHKKRVFFSIAGSFVCVSVGLSMSPTESQSYQGDIRSIIMSRDSESDSAVSDKPLVFVYAEDSEAAATAAQGNNESSVFESFMRHIPFPSVKPVQPSLTVPTPDTAKVTIGKGETLVGVLNKHGASHQEASAVAAALSPLYKSKSFRAGQTITVSFKSSPDSGRYLNGISFETDAVKGFSVSKKTDGSYAAKSFEKALIPHLQAAKGSITSSLSQAAEKAGVPMSILNKMIAVYSWDVDFQRDIQPNDKFEVLFERSLDENGKAIKSGEFVYANLVLSGKQHKIYRHHMKDGTVDYFKEDGISVKRQLMRTPINGARVSSSFGMRKHPILGYSKKHEGLDFAAPTGTPIYAAGNGIIVKAGPFSSYGNYVKIRHRSGLETAYAHMSRIAKGIKPGQRVEQKQIIGYVGTTGRSTGPHLHYEVIIANKKVNPARVDLPTGIELKGKELAVLKNTMGNMNKSFASAMEKGPIRTASR